MLKSGNDLLFSVREPLETCTQDFVRALWKGRYISSWTGLLRQIFAYRVYMHGIGHIFLCNGGSREMERHRNGRNLDDNSSKDGEDVLRVSPHTVSNG